MEKEDTCCKKTPAVIMEDGHSYEEREDTHKDIHMSTPQKSDILQ